MCGSYKAPAKSAIQLAQDAVSNAYTALVKLETAERDYRRSGGGRTSGCSITKEARAYRDALKSVEKAHGVAHTAVHNALAS